MARKQSRQVNVDVRKERSKVRQSFLGGSLIDVINQCLTDLDTNVAASGISAS